MPKAQSVFFYGIFVKSALLCFASDAFETSRGSLLAIDMIKARRQDDKLNLTPPYDALTRFSEEIWQLVKEQVIEQGMSSAADLQVGVWDSNYGEGWLPSEGLKVWRQEILDDSPELTENYRENDGARGMLKVRLKSIKSLLDSFGLALPIESPLIFPEMKGSDIDALAPLAIPLKSSKPTNSFPCSTAALPRDEDDPTHSLVNFSPSSLNLPSNANLRLLRFLSLFNLKAEEPPAPMFYTPSISKPSATSTEEGSSEVKGNSSVKVEPRWHLVTSCSQS